MAMVLWRAVARKRVAAGGLAALACCGIAAGCGSSSSTTTTAAKPLAERLCDGARAAAATQLGTAVRSRVVNPAASNLVCSLRGHRVQVKIVSQASGAAYTEWNTEDSHQAQVYGAASAGVHNAGQQPLPASVPGAVVAIWIRAQKMIVATDASPTSGNGSYVTVTVSGKGVNNRDALSLAQTVARATFAAHPSVGS